MATPHPERELDRARKLAKAGLPRLVVACGKEAFFRGEAMDLLLAAVPKDAELVTIEGLDVADTRGGGAEDELEDAEEAAAPVVANAGAVPELQVLRGGGLFAKRAFLVVRRADKWVKRHGTALLAFLPKVAAGSGLVLELQSLDRRTKLAKALDAAGEFLEFRELYERPFGRDDGEIAGELVQWVVQRASAMGVPLSAEAALLMTAQVGKAPSELAAELQRLRDQFAGAPKGKPLQPADLRGKLSVQFESTPFELAEAVLNREKEKAWRSLRGMFERGVRQRDGRRMDQQGVFPFAVSWLFQSMAKLHEGRQLMEQGANARDVAGRLGVKAFAERFTAQLQRSTEPMLREGLLALLECQRRMRLQGDDPELLLEQFLMQWFDGVRLRPARELEA